MCAFKTHVHADQMKIVNARFINGFMNVTFLLYIDKIFLHEFYTCSYKKLNVLMDFWKRQEKKFYLWVYKWSLRNWTFPRFFCTWISHWKEKISNFEGIIKTFSLKVLVKKSETNFLFLIDFKVFIEAWNLFSFMMQIIENCHTSSMVRSCFKRFCSDSLDKKRYDCEITVFILNQYSKNYKGHMKKRRIWIYWWCRG